MAERPTFVLAERYGQSPQSIREWSDYDFKRALLYVIAENGGSKVTQDDVELNIAKRKEGAMPSILDRAPQHWASRTRADVEKEGYNVDYIADELAAQGLTFVGESLPVKSEAEKFDTGPLEPKPEEVED